MKTFEQENDELLKYLLDKRFFEVWEEGSDNTLWKATNLELFITSTCNLKCEYCYLNRFEDKLYPKENRKPKDILNNLKILFNWFSEKNFYFHNIDLFSGEIWHTHFGFDVFDVILNGIYNGVQIDSITIPTNCSFLMEDKTMHKMQHYINLFDKLGTRLTISCSIEGKMLEEETRSFKDENQNDKRNDLFYEKLFAFCKRNNYLFHPMVAAANVDKWIDNLKWYRKQLQDINYYDLGTIMMLEVRNDDWNEESIKNLLKFFDFEINEHLKMVNNDIETFANDILGKGGDSSNIGYINYALVLSESQAPCSIPTTLTIRVGDLAIPPCHRLAYDKFIYGKFEVDNDNKITDIKANNPQMAIRILASNNKLAHHKCDSCKYNIFCMGGCFGSQYESSQDPFMPAESVCDMFKAKYDYLIDKYEELGVFKYWEKIPKYDPYYEIAQEMLKGVKSIKNDRIN